MKREVIEWVDKAEQEVAKEAITLSGVVRDELRHLLSLSKD
jgi:hypothetical protein